MVEIGAVTGPHGVRGAVKVRLHNADTVPLKEIDPAQLVLRGASGETWGGVRVTGQSAGSAVICIGGVSDRDAAAALRGATLFVAREALPLGDDEVLYADLVGCEVREGDLVLGTVAGVFCAGASDVLVVRSTNEERLIPFVDDWVVDVDLVGKTIELRHTDQWEAHPIVSKR